MILVPNLQNMHKTYLTRLFLKFIFFFFYDRGWNVVPGKNDYKEKGEDEEDR